MTDRTFQMPDGSIVVEQVDTRTMQLPTGSVIAETAVTPAGGANPKGPLGMPLHGPLGGPV